MTIVATAASVPNRAMILASVMLATIMTSLDVTIANVALPHMAGSVSASADQITWVLTSYIVATAIAIPTTGWLTARLGRKWLFLVSIIGFTVASALCGAAQSLGQIVLFRVLQGVFGAAMMPLSQSVVLDYFPIEERGPVMAIWGMGVMVAPILGPVLGGWLTDDFSWRWVFYINLPIGVICALGVWTFIHEGEQAERIPFDFTGFGLLSVSLAALQLFLDRGQSNDWFNSSEIVIEASVSGLAFVLFTIHTFTAERPFLPVALLADRNFVAATVLGLVVGMLVFSVLALLPPMTETLLGYPVVTTGLVTAPRGVGSLVSMFFAGRLIGRADNRLLIVAGLALFAASFFTMSHFSLQMDSAMIVWSGFVQGLGSGFVFLPMTALAFTTLSPALRADGTSVFTLVRNLGNSVGISIMQALFTQNASVVHARLVEPLRPDNPLVQSPTFRAAFSLTNPAGVAALNGEVTRQAAMVAYIDVFHIMFLITLAMIPLVLMLREQANPVADADRQSADPIPAPRPDDFRVDGRFSILPVSIGDEDGDDGR